MQYQKEAHKVYSLYYHVIFVVKYRQKVFLEGNDIINDAKERMVELSESHDVEIVEIECGIDHVHLLVGAKPTLDIPKWINSVKGNTSRFLREKHADFLRDKLWGDHFWSPSYFIATTGNVSIDVLKQYIEEQRGRLARED
jgi:putative transposase